tara:strand:- start:1549 stop:2091 length:543 start_codon:yes stop_codon:yes gene_type:complete
MGCWETLLFCCAMLVCEKDTIPLQISAPKVVDAFVVGQPHRKAEWETTPSVRICEESGVSFIRITQAVRYWEMLGYEFDDISKDGATVCAPPRYGEIVVRLPDGTFNDNHIASTRLYTRISSEKIIKAQIHIFPHSATKARVLEHEIGHALGWSHYPQRYHIMHPTWLYGGFGSQGLRKR